MPDRPEENPLFLSDNTLGEEIRRKGKPFTSAGPGEWASALERESVTVAAVWEKGRGWAQVELAPVFETAQRIH